VAKVAAVKNEFDIILKCLDTEFKKDPGDRANEDFSVHGISRLQQSSNSLPPTPAVPSLIQRTSAEIGKEDTTETAKLDQLQLSADEPRETSQVANAKHKDPASRILIPMKIEPIVMEKMVVTDKEELGPTEGAENKRGIEAKEQDAVDDMPCNMPRSTVGVSTRRDQVPLKSPEEEIERCFLPRTTRTTLENWRLWG